MIATESLKTVQRIFNSSRILALIRLKVMLISNNSGPPTSDLNLERHGIASVPKKTILHYPKQNAKGPMNMHDLLPFFFNLHFKFYFIITAMHTS